MNTSRLEAQLREDLAVPLLSASSQRPVHPAVAVQDIVLLLLAQVHALLKCTHWCNYHFLTLRDVKGKRANYMGLECPQMAE